MVILDGKQTSKEIKDEDKLDKKESPQAEINNTEK